ncbi:MAG: M23 family metallopeptidase [Thermomonas sp.]
MRSERSSSRLRGLLLLLLGGLVGANATYFLMARQSVHEAPASVDPATSPGTHLPTSSSKYGTPRAADGADTAQHQAGPMLPSPAARINGSATATGSTSPAMPAHAAGAGLLVPVRGVMPSQLSDTFTDSRSAGRSHDAIDIMAATGTPVLAVADGHVEKLFSSKLGGLTIYEFNPDGTLAYYYAHLQRYADGLAERKVITRGQVIGYVGWTGNANPDAPHLHFAIFKLGPDKQWWKGDAINPYPELGGTPR